jgi:hypothetical protein
MVCALFFSSASIVVFDYGHGLDMEELFSSDSIFLVGLLCVSSSMLLSKWLSYIQIGDTIIFSFFFFGWRNSNYEAIMPRFNRLFSSLETM